MPCFCVSCFTPRKLRVFGALVVLAQLATFVGLAVLEYLSEYRAGVMQHLYYNKVHYMNGLFRQEYMLLHVAALIVVAAGVFSVCAVQRGTMRMVEQVWYLFISLSAVAAFAVPECEGLNSYPYILMSLQACVALEIVRTVMLSRARYREQVEA